MRVNLSNDSSGGGGVTPAVHVQNPEEVSHTPPPATPGATAAPPAAAAVIAGEVTEETIRLRQENEQLKQTVKDRELTICQEQDKHAAYRKQIEEGQTVPVNQGDVPTKGRRFLKR